MKGKRVTVTVWDGNDTAQAQWSDLDEPGVINVNGQSITVPARSLDLMYTALHEIFGTRRKPGQT